MRARQLVIASGLLVATFAAAPAREAHAQSSSGTAYPPACSAATVPQSESERAHTIYQAGKVQYDDKNYDAAIVQFRDAYKRDCSKHDLLIIISRAYELKGDKVEALKALETYVRARPELPGPHDAPERHRLAEEADRGAASAAVRGARAPLRPRRRRRSVSTPSRRGSWWASVAPPRSPASFSSPPSPTRAATSTRRSAPRAPRRRRGTTPAPSARGASRVRFLIGGGLAIVAGGLLWHFLEPTGPVEKTGKLKPSVTPQVAPGYAGMSLGGSF